MSGRIVRSIWSVVGLLLLAQLAILAVVATAYGIAFAVLVWYGVSLVALHALTAAALTLLRELFVNVETDAAYERVNAANVLTLLRLSSAPTLLALLLLVDAYPILPVLIALAVIVFLTDLFDGQVSRRAGQVTRIGRHLDSASDYVVLFVVAIALAHYRLVDRWLFWILIVRFGAHAAGQATIFLAQRMRIEFRSSFLGKASVFASMSLFALALLRIVPAMPEWYTTAFVYAEYGVAVIAFVSLGEKAMEFVRQVRRKR